MEYKNEIMSIDALIPADYNPRKDLQEGDAEFEKIKRSIEEFGFVEPIVWNKRTGVIVGGHQRLKVAKALGYEEVPVSVVDLSEEREKVLNVALNKVGGEFDESKLAELMRDLDGFDIDTELTGFDGIEIDAMIKSLEIRENQDMSFLDDILGDGDDDEDGYEDEEIEGVQTPEGYVKFQTACTVEEREIIIEAINVAKKYREFGTTNEALTFISDFFLKTMRKKVENNG